MAKLTKSDVEHVADLANFKLSDQESKKVQGELAETLNFIKKLDIVDTEKVVPTSQVTGSRNVVRRDVSRPSLSQKQALENSPDSYNSFFRTKPVFDRRNE